MITISGLLPYEYTILHTKNKYNRHIIYRRSKRKISERYWERDRQTEGEEKRKKGKRERVLKVRLTTMIISQKKIEYIIAAIKWLIFYAWRTPPFRKQLGVKFL